MKKIILVGIIGYLSLLCAYEPSVYGAGDIDSAEPYGLTATERNVLANRRQVQLLSNRVAEQQNRIDGLTSAIEGLNKEVVELKEQLVRLQSKDDANKTYALLLNLGKMIDKINSNYVTQEDLQMALSSRSTLGGGGGAIYNPSMDSSMNSTGTLDLDEIYREGVQLFSRKSYGAAQAKFEQVLANNHKPASTNYYLGEIAYYTNNYTDAINYYKKSASINDQASYMKILYLHIGMALARTGQERQARGFFEYLINHYPNSRAAEIARKNL